MLSMCAATAKALNPKNFKHRTIITNACCAKRCHRAGARNMRKNFSVGAILQNADACDE
jgi:hypothetical protein